MASSYLLFEGLLAYIFPFVSSTSKRRFKAAEFLSLFEVAEFDGSWKDFDMMF